MRVHLEFDPTLYLVTDPELAGGRALTEIVTDAVRGGVTLVQLRDKHADDRVLLEQAHALKALLDPLGIPLIVNDRVEIARATGVGCHIGQSDLPAEEARRLLGPDVILGVSIDQPEQARAANPEIVDYVAHGPCATTATKPDAGAAVGLAGMRKARALTRLPLIAIVGIDAGNAAEAIAGGADGIAVVSAIMATPDPAAASRRLRATIDAARLTVAEDQA
jgi:thiamine-phosphate pyrophosphorylase